MIENITETHVINMKMYISGLLMGFFIGGLLLFKQGYESAKFDQKHANEKLQQCLGVIRK